ncbi:MAG: lipocalin family protein [Nonlabens sp.]
MNKYFTLLSVFAIFFISCEDDKELNEGEVDINAIVGTWTFTDVDVDIETSSDLTAGVPINVANTSLDSSNTDATVTFNADGTYTAQGNVTLVTTQTGLGSDSQTQNVDGTSGQYTISGRIITFTDSDFLSIGRELEDLTPDYSIGTLNGTEFILNVTAEGNVDFFGSQLDLDATGIIELTK